MDWLEPIVKWLVILAAVFGGAAIQHRRGKRAGAAETKLEQMQEGNRAQERQSKAMRAQRTRDLLDDLGRVRDKNRGDRA